MDMTFEEQFLRSFFISKLQLREDLQSDRREHAGKLQGLFIFIDFLGTIMQGGY